MKHENIEYAKQWDYIKTDIPACQQKIGGASHLGPETATKSSHIKYKCQTPKLEYKSLAFSESTFMRISTCKCQTLIS